MSSPPGSSPPTYCTRGRALALGRFSVWKSTGPVAMLDFFVQVLANVAANLVGLGITVFASLLVVGYVHISRRNRLVRFFGLDKQAGVPEVRIYLSNVH